MNPRDQIIKALKEATGLPAPEINLEFPEREEFGDYTSNIALQMKNPRETAEAILEKLQKDKELAKVVEQIEVAGPGFINFWLSRESHYQNLEEIIKKKEKYGQSDLGQAKTVVIDYSSPNIAKRFGIGHLRSTIIGQALYNFYSCLGYRVIGDNHLGDWGTQFGALLYQIVSKKLEAEDLEIDQLERLYVEFHQEAEEKPELRDEARKWFKKLEDGDSQAKQIWKTLVKTSLQEFEKIYQLLEIKIDYTYGESFYRDKMQAVISEARKKGIVKKSQGAEIIEFSSTGSGPVLPPAILVKSDGATTYFTRDLAAIKFRLEKFDPKIFIYEVGADQTLYFRQLFEAVRLLGWRDDREFVHVAHGLIRFEHGKMSTRRGQTIKLEEVLNEAIRRAKKLGNSGETAKQVGIGAVKYFDLSHQPASDIIFDWEKMFLMEGNSGPYLQYTVVRVNSVLAKATFKGTSLQGVSSACQDLDLNEEEMRVLRALVKFPEVIANAAKSYSPNLLCNYLFDLAQKFNAFYNKHRILKPHLTGDHLAARQAKSGDLWRVNKFRLALTAATGQVLKNGLHLLGIQTPEKM